MRISTFLATLLFFSTCSLGAACEESVYALKRKADFGDIEAQLEMGKRQDDKVGRLYLEKAAESGNTEANLLLGDKFLDERNLEKAVKYFEVAHNQGSPEGKQKLAYTFFLMAKEPVKVDFTGIYLLYGLNPSFEYFKKSADLGYAEAQYKVAKILNMPDENFSLKERYGHGDHYLKLAADQGVEGAVLLLSLKSLGCEIDELTLDDLEKPELQKLLAPIKELADEGYGKAKAQLAVIYLIVGKVCTPEIMELLESAVCENNSLAHHLLGTICAGQYGPDHLDVEKAYHHLTLANTLCKKKNPKTAQENELFYNDLSVHIEKLKAGEESNFGFIYKF